MKRFPLLFLFFLIITGCSIFKTSRRMDMAPFAENTSTLFTEAIKIERTFQYKHLRPYTIIPEFQKTSQLSPPILKALRGIIYYSNQVVAINNANMSERNKSRMLATYLSEQIERVLAEKRPDSLQLDLEGAKPILENIRNAKKYLDAIAAAEPIVHSVVSVLMEKIDEIQNQMPLIIEGFNREIERDFAVPRQNYNRLIDLQNKLMLSVTRLYNARIGDREELEKLLQENASIKYYIPSADKATHDNMRAAEQFLLDQVQAVEEMITQLDDIKTVYRAKQDEVVAWRTDLDSKILMARTSLTIWARSHKNLGAGIPVPPLIDVSGIATNLAGKAVNTVLP